MTEVLNKALSQNKCDISTIINALKEENTISQLRITQKGSKRLISILKNELDKQNGIQKVIIALSILSQNDYIINQFVNLSTYLPSICDRLIAVAMSSTKCDTYNQKSLFVIFDLINQSDKLKSQLCMSIQENILCSIEQKTIQNSLLPKTMEILVSCVTHHQENRTFFIKNTSKEKISAVFNLAKSTGNTMVQIFSVEFLWRVAIPMKMSNEERNKIFGKYTQQLFDIRAESFREGIINFVEMINQERTDPQRIIQVKIRNLMIYSTIIPGTHFLYFGTDSILIWISKSLKIPQIARNIELITLTQNDINGIGISDDNIWCIGLTQEYDKLTDFFDSDQKPLFFQVIGNNKTIFSIVQQRFGKLDFIDMPKPKQLPQDKPLLTPSIQTKVPLYNDFQIPRNKSETPKTSKSILSENANKESENSTIKLKNKTLNEKIVDEKIKIDKKPEIKSSPLKNRKTVENAHSSSTSSDSEDNFLSKKTKTKPEKGKDQTLIIQSRKQTKNSPKLSNKQNSSFYLTKKHEYDSSSTNNSDTESNPNINNYLIDYDELPLVTICGSYKESNLNETKSSDSSEPNFPESDNLSDYQKGQQIKIELHSINNKDDKFSDRNEEGKFISIKKKHENSPEKWELDTFEELKKFGFAIHSRISERHLMLNRSIDEIVSQSMKEISIFMSKCDSDLEKFSNDFTESTSQITKEIEQKKRMITQLGDQQNEHIIHMIHDCELLQKRAKEIIKRFGEQKKQLLMNQAKHIELFQEDIKSELKTTINNKKKENSKKFVQKLVTLLDEL